MPSFPGPAVSPERILEGLTAFRVTSALKAGIEVDLFTGIAEGKTTPSGDAYTFPEHQRMFSAAGFDSVESNPLLPTFFTVVQAHK